MKILFVTGLYSFEQIESIREFAYGNIQNASNTFQWAIVEGLEKNNVDFEVVSLPFLPSYPKRYKNLYSMGGDIVLNENTIGAMLSYCNLVVYKTLSIRRNLYSFVKNWVLKNYRNNEKLVILTYTLYPPFLKVAKSIKNRYPNVVISSIVTDLVDDMMSFKSNRTILKRIQCHIEQHETRKLYSQVDKYILLSKHMVERIPISLDKHIVVEGISVEKDLNITDFSRRDKVLLYTGSLAAFSGIKELIQAFKKIEDKNIQLMICGGGDLQHEVIQASKDDKRIIYTGILPREEVLKLQKKATLLINPRRSDGMITKYSFPSKTMEYLSSGTPMIGYRLDGIPDEYYPYFFAIEDLSEQSLIKCINTTFSLSSEILKKKAVDAYDFIMNNKTSKIQVKKIIDFLND